MIRFCVLTFAIVFAVYADPWNYCKFVRFMHCSKQHTHEECGTDGVTYRTNCDFMKAHCANEHIHLAHRGSCIGTQVVVSPTNGTHILPDIFCQNIKHTYCHGIHPICGTDGNTYDNECEFEKAKCVNKTLHVDALGVCP